MLLVLWVLCCVATVPLVGGQVRRLSALRIVGWPLATAALVVQVLIISVVANGPSGLYRALHLATYAAVGLVLCLNRRIRGFLVVAAGTLANAVAISANSGVMPASPTALRAAGRAVVTTKFTNSEAVRHPRLPALGDIFALPRSWPLHNVFSVGDVAIALGLLIAVWEVCGTTWSASRAEAVTR